MMTVWEKTQRAKKVQALLSRAFKVLRRRHKMLARQRFMCCRGCAATALVEEMRGKLDSSFGGVVLSIKQHGEFIERSRLSIPAIRNVNLYYGSLEIDGKEYGPDRKVVGDRIVKVFEELGVPYQWNGDQEEIIRVVVPLLETKLVRMEAKMALVEVARKGVVYEVLLSDCCGRPWVVSNVRRKPDAERGHPKRQTGGKLRQEISQAASLEVEMGAQQLSPSLVVGS